MSKHIGICCILLACGSGCDVIEAVFTPTPFNVEVTPKKVDDAIPLQNIVFMVTVEDAREIGFSGPVRISATAPNATVTVQNTPIDPGEMAEVTVIPDANTNGTVDTNGVITVTVTGFRRGWEETATATINVVSQEQDLVGPEAATMRDLFIPWLAENRPELGITADTKWTGTIVKPHWLVVTHYLYFSGEWEMHVSWHVMIPPYDWAQMELRRRYTDLAPTIAYEIPSRTADPLEFNEIAPSDSVWR